MNKEEQKVLNENDHEASYFYCLYNKEANISLHEDIICKLNDAYYIFAFARDIEGTNINKLEEAIIKSNDLYYIYTFAKDIEKSNKERLFRKLLELNDLHYINGFLKNIDFDKEKYKNLLLFI